MDPYHTLGVSSGATHDEIKGAYRKLVKEFHPDKNNSEEAKERVRLINAAYEVLSDPVKRSQYNQPAYAGVQVEDDPIEAYKREFQRKRWEKAQQKKARRLSREKTTYKVVRLVTFPIFMFAVILLLDNFLPMKTHDETPVAGWQERLAGGRYSRGELVSYMETPNFYIRVPHEFHLAYPHYDNNKPPVTISTTPILNIPRNLHSSFGGYSWTMEVPGTIYSNIFPLPWLLFLSSLYVVARKKFSRLHYALCFLPVLFLALVIVSMA